MATPTKEQIRERATGLFNKSNNHLPSITPEDSELKESGYWFEARDDLMRDNAKHQQLAYLEEMAHEIGYRIVKEKKTPVNKNQINLQSILKTGLVVIASKGHGKTNTVKTICQRFQNEMPNVGLKVVDSALNWAFNSPLDYYQIIELGKTIINRKNTVFDCSLLKHPQLVTDFIRKLVFRDLEANVRLKLRQYGYIDKPILYVIEETQNILGTSSLKRDINAPILKFVSEGRNFGELSYIIITQRPQSISTEALERVEGYLFGRLLGDRNLTKVRRIAGKNVAKSVKKLKQGEFIYFDGDKAQHFNFDKYVSTHKPKRLDT